MAMFNGLVRLPEGKWIQRHAPMVMKERRRKGATVGLSIFPTNIPYSMGSGSELLKVSQQSNRTFLSKKSTY